MQRKAIDSSRFCKLGVALLPRFCFIWVTRFLYLLLNSGRQLERWGNNLTQNRQKDFLRLATLLQSTNSHFFVSHHVYSSPAVYKSHVCIRVCRMCVYVSVHISMRLLLYVLRAAY